MRPACRQGGGAGATGGGGLPPSLPPSLPAGVQPGRGGGRGRGRGVSSSVDLMAAAGPAVALWPPPRSECAAAAAAGRGEEGGKGGEGRGGSPPPHRAAPSPLTRKGRRPRAQRSLRQRRPLGAHRPLSPHTFVLKGESTQRQALSGHTWTHGGTRRGTHIPVQNTPRTWIAALRPRAAFTRGPEPRAHTTTESQHRPDPDTGCNPPPVLHAVTRASVFTQLYAGTNRHANLGLCPPTWLWKLMLSCSGLGNWAQGRGATGARAHPKPSLTPPS